MGFSTHQRSAVLVRVDSASGLGDYLQLHIVRTQGPAPDLPTFLPKSAQSLIAMDQPLESFPPVGSPQDLRSLIPGVPC